MRLTVNISDKDVFFLSGTRGACFYADQKERFELIEPKTNQVKKKLEENRGTFNFCESFVNAKLMREYYRRKSMLSAILYDSSGSWVVWVNKKYE
jgi:hypothetical protein